MASSQNNLALVIGSLGVVFGDIGTSPLYAFKSCFSLSELIINNNNVYGILSLIFWLLILIVNYKYIFLLMKCDKQGEGGILVLLSFCSKINSPKLQKLLLYLGLVGTALFFGDSVITPAISVLSAVEGLKLVTDITQTQIVIIAGLILVFLFILQSKGTEAIGKYFGVLMLIWFLMIGVAGLRQILLAPLVLKALNPFYAIKFALENNGLLLIIMSAVIIVITGVEALYADLGHFNKKIIRQAWLYIALPSLVFNYFGQGALLLNNNLAIDNTFYLLIPEKFRLISIIISLIATIIASQAVISGLFSSISQAIMLDFLPKIKIVHTSSRYQGQIYIPQVNFYLMVMTIFAVLFFQKSENLANAYGLSVAGVMLISSILLIIVAKFIWQWSNKKIFIYLIPLLFLDGLFIIANLTKVIHGGWYTLLLASILFCLFYCWLFGKKLLKKSSLENNLEETLLNYSSKYPRNIPGCAVFTCYNNIPPRSLSIQLEHFKSLQQKNIILSIKIENQPRVAHKKFVVKKINDNIYILNAKFGFYEQIDYNQITTWLIKHEFLSNSEDISYIFSRIVPITNKNVFNIKSLINYIYIMMVKNSVSPHEFFKINYTKVIELGTRYQIE